MHRRDVLGVEAFAAVRDRIHSAHRGDLRGKRGNDRGVVDHRARQYPDVAAGLLLPSFGDAENGRHLRAGIGGRNGEDGQARLEGNGLGEPDGRAASDGDRAVGVESPRLLAGGARHLDRDMHHRAVEDSGAAAGEAAFDVVGGSPLRRGKHERSPRAQKLDLALEVREASRSEQHPGTVEGEGDHAHMSCGGGTSAARVTRCSSAKVSPSTISRTRSPTGVTSITARSV